MRVLGVLTATLIFAGSAHAAVLTFDGNICNNGNACGNGSEIDQTYGDMTGVDVIYDRDRTAPGNDPVYFWNTGYETLENVAYGTLGGGGLSIVFEAATGYDVMVSAFDIAPYLDRVRDTLVQVIDLTNNTLLVDQNFTPLSTAGPTAFNGSWFSTTGIQINLGPDAWDVGIDNVTYSAMLENGPPQVPLPASALLLGAGLFGLGAIGRRRAKS